jgi:hypothetical protein
MDGKGNGDGCSKLLYKSFEKTGDASEILKTI